MGIEQMPDINKIRKELDEKNAEMEKKERERIKEEYERLSEQEKPTEEPITKEDISKSEKEQPIQIEDITDEFTPENVKVAENVKAAYEKGKFIEVKVKGSSGKIENDWVISKINPKTGEATVLKFTSEEGENRSFEDKIVTLEELKEWNKPETKESKEKKEKTEKKKEKLTKKDKNKTKEKSGEEKENLKKDLTEKYGDELEKIKQMPDDTKKLKKAKATRCFELIDHWKNLGYLDNYKGVLNTFSELNGLESSIFLYDLDKADIINDVCSAMAENYKKWDLKDKEKLKIIKGFVDKESKKRNIFYSKDKTDKTLKKIAETLALEDVPFKGNIDIIVENIENADIKSKTIETILEIENKPIGEKEELLERMEEDKTKEKMLSEEKIKKMGASEEIMEKLEDPKILSQLFTKGSKFLAEGSELLKDQKIQKKVQEVMNLIEKKGKEKIPDCVAEAAKLIKGEKKEGKKDGKESPWKTVFEGIGLLIVILIAMSILLGLKGNEILSGQATGKKKEKK